MTPRTRHVWIRPPNLPTEYQGFLLEWRQRDGGWVGRVLYVDAQGREVSEWIGRDAIRPVVSEPHTGVEMGG